MSHVSGKFWDCVQEDSLGECHARRVHDSGRGITRQVLATVPLRARLNGHEVVAGLPVLTEELIPVAGWPS